MLEARNVTVRYGRVPALAGVSVSVAAGEIVALLGPNGAGKTTTLRVLSGLLPPESGTVHLDEKDVTGHPAERFASAGVAHVPEGRGIFHRLSVAQNLVVGLYPRRRERVDRNAVVEQAVDRFPALRDRLTQKAGTLSGGEQQMLALGRALVSRPRIVLVDEPSHGLAPNVAGELFDLFEKLRADGIGLLVVEQYADLVLPVADRAYVLEKGSVTYEGSPSRLRRSRTRLTEAYLGRIS